MFVNKHIDIMPAVSMLEPGDSTVRFCAKNARNKIIFSRGGVTVPGDQHVELYESRWDLWVDGQEGGMLLWKKSCESCAAVYYTQSHRKCVWCTEEGCVKWSNVCELHIEEGLMPLEREAQGATSVSCANYIGYFVDTDIRFVVTEHACRAFFMADKSLKDVCPFESPRCVNACYTTAIAGLVQRQHTLTTINKRNERGPCGSEFYISSVLGVLHIFPSSQGARRVTCKAFANVDEAELALCMACNELRVESVSPIVVHMIIMKGNIGRHVDISQHGNLAGLLAKTYEGCVVFTPRIDEVNVHATCKWPSLWRAYSSYSPPMQLLMMMHRAVLQRAELNLSVTRLGTCIYNIAIKKPHGTRKRPRKDAPTGPEDDISQTIASNEVTGLLERCLFMLSEEIHDNIVQNV